jgi:peptide/nickel transport system substrate-binding protein
VQAQEHLHQTAGTLIPYHVTKLYALNSRVKNFDMVVNEAIRWHKITVE